MKLIHCILVVTCIQWSVYLNAQNLDRYLPWEAASLGFRINQDSSNRAQLSLSSGTASEIIDDGHATFRFDDSETSISVAKCSKVKSRDCVNYLSPSGFKFYTTQFSSNGETLKSVCDVGRPEAATIGKKPVLGSCLTFTKKSCADWSEYKSNSPSYKALSENFEDKAKQCNDLIAKINEVRKAVGTYFATSDNTLDEVQTGFDKVRTDKFAGVFLNPAKVSRYRASNISYLKISDEIKSASDECDNAIQRGIFLADKEYQNRQNDQVRYLKSLMRSSPNPIPDSRVPKAQVAH